MSRRPHYLVDNSVLVSALLFTDSVPGRAVETALARGDLLVSNSTFAELCEVLRRVKFDRYITRKDREQFLVLLLLKATLVECKEVIHECRDPNDDKFLELAVGGNADFIVTGDEDLLILHPFRGIAILSPAQFMESIA